MHIVLVREIRSRSSHASAADDPSPMRKPSRPGRPRPLQRRRPHSTRTDRRPGSHGRLEAYAATAAAAAAAAACYGPQAPACRTRAERQPCRRACRAGPGRETEPMRRAARYIYMCTYVYTYQCRYRPPAGVAVGAAAAGGQGWQQSPRSGCGPWAGVAVVA
jgi:hypothetical protein